MKFGGVAATAVGVIALAGCGGGETPAAETVTVTSSSSSAPTTTTSTTAPSATASADASSMALGAEAVLPEITFTVSEVKEASSEHSRLPADQQWWSVMIEGCAKADEITVSWSPWGIQGDDGGTYPASSSTWGDFPRPQYPVMRPVANGQCAKGWIMVALNSGVSPESVEYANDRGDTFTWSVN